MLFLELLQLLGSGLPSCEHLVLLVPWEALWRHHTTEAPIDTSEASIAVLAQAAKLLKF